MSVIVLSCQDLRERDLSADIFQASCPIVLRVSGLRNPAEAGTVHFLCYRCAFTRASFRTDVLVAWASVGFCLHEEGLSTGLAVADGVGVCERAPGS